MGNYSGTTRCSHCYGTGHNKAGCPKLKERIERLRETNPDHWQVLQADRAAEKRNQRATAPRCCKYCKANRKTVYAGGSEWADKTDEEKSQWVSATTGEEKGSPYYLVERDTLYSGDHERGLNHTQRTCKYRKRDIAVAVERTAAFRKEVLSSMKAAGIGKGGSIRFPESIRTEDRADGRWVIESIRWPAILSLSENMQPSMLGDFIHLCDVRFLMHGNKPYNATMMVGLPVSCTEEDHTAYRSWQDHFESVIRPVAADRIDSDVPDGWLEATDQPTMTRIETHYKE